MSTTAGRDAAAVSHRLYRLKTPRPLTATPEASKATTHLILERTERAFPAFSHQYTALFLGCSKCQKASVLEVSNQLKPDECKYKALFSTAFNKLLTRDKCIVEFWISLDIGKTSVTPEQIWTSHSNI